MIWLAVILLVAWLLGWRSTWPGVDSPAAGAGAGGVPVQLHQRAEDGVEPLDLGCRKGRPSGGGPSCMCEPVANEGSAAWSAAFPLRGSPPAWLRAGGAGPPPGHERGARGVRSSSIPPRSPTVLIAFGSSPPSLPPSPRGRCPRPVGCPTRLLPTVRYFPPPGRIPPDIGIRLRRRPGSTSFRPARSAHWSRHSSSRTGSATPAAAGARMAALAI